MTIDWRARFAERDAGYITPCHEWQGGRNANGRGVVRVEGRLWEIHRLVWIDAHGEPLPDSPCVLHRCDNPLCGRLDHLFTGTRGDNNRDRSAKGRSGRNNLRGETHGSAKLTERDVIAVLADARPQRDIAAEHGVSPSTISLIRTGKNWRHIPR